MQSAAAPRYWAFLSYSHADSAQARRLHALLERYVLPGRARKAHGLPRRLFPIFRDVEELEAAAGLTTRLQAALAESRWLIVLCSPQSAQSKYVNEEIECFLERHGPGRVLCVLLEGQPPECFPPAIRALKEEPLAADCRAGRDRDIAKLKLIAALAGVGFTELRDREAQRKKSTRLLLATAALLTASSALAYWDLMVREQLAYYVNTVRINGIWQGVDAVTPDIAAHRTATYRFTRHGRLNPPQRVDYVDGGGACHYEIYGNHEMRDILDERPSYGTDWQTNPALAYCSAQFVYAADGSLREETLRNGLGHAAFSLVYTTATLAQITQEGYAAISEGGGIRYVTFVRDAEGRDLERHFSYGPNQPRRNQAFAYGHVFGYDARGRVLRRDALDSEGRAMGRVERFTHTRQGYLSGIRYEDLQARPRPGVGGQVRDGFDVDQHGNVFRRTGYSVSDQPMRMSSGFAAERITHDEQGRISKVCFFDEIGRSTSSDRLSACERYRINAQGRMTRLEHVDAEGQLRLLGPEAAAEIDYDPRGNPVEMRFYDVQNQLTATDFTGAIMRMRNDAFGKLLQVSFFGPDGEPASPSGIGAQSVRFQYDARGRQIEKAFLGLDQQPIVIPSGGYAIKRLERDERGNVLAKRYYGADLKPMLLAENLFPEDGIGYASVVYQLDGAGNAVEQRYLDTAERLIDNSNGLALIRSQFDGLGQKIEERYYDARQQPALGPDGAYGYRARFDAQGRKAQLSYLDAEAQPGIAPQLGYAGVRYEAYLQDSGSSEGELFTAASYLDAAGTIISRETRRYNWNNDLTEVRYFDALNQPAPAPRSGCAVQTYGYAALDGAPTQEACLNAAGQPMPPKPQG